MRFFTDQIYVKGEGTVAWGTFNFKSRTLNMPVEAEVLIPQNGYKSLKKADGYKVVILLHGVRNDRTEWLLKSQIFDMVRELPILVFMPSGKNSFYVNTYNGYKYMDYITREIPDFIKSHFRVSDNSKDWLIAGSSMGGYGAMLCGLHQSDTFGNIASFSGALDIRKVNSMISRYSPDQLFDPDFDKNLNNENDLFYLHKKIDEKLRPRIYMCCGDEDDLLSANHNFYECIKDSYDVTAVWGKGGHDFVYWNERLKDVFKWFCPEELKRGVFMGRCGSDFC